MRLLEGTVAVMTGATGDIGSGTARLFAREGAKLSLGYYSAAGKATQISRECQDLGAEAVSLGVDVTQRNDVEEFIAESLGKFGRIDCLAALHGVWSADIWEKRLVDVTEDEWRVVIDDDLKGTFHLCKSVLPHMTTQNGNAGHRNQAGSRV